MAAGDGRAGLSGAEAEVWALRPARRSSAGGGRGTEACGGRGWEAAGGRSGGRHDGRDGYGVRWSVRWQAQRSSAGGRAGVRGRRRVGWQVCTASGGFGGWLGAMIEGGRR
jgi:hypothetical protein